MANDVAMRDCASLKREHERVQNSATASSSNRPPHTSFKQALSQNATAAATKQKFAPAKKRKPLMPIDEPKFCSSSSCSSVPALAAGQRQQDCNMLHLAVSLLDRLRPTLSNAT